MKPAPFLYCAPSTVEEVVALLAEHGDEAKVIAGGQSLVPTMNMRLAQPSVLVDIGAVPGLDGIQANGQLTIGATARQAAVLRSAAVADFSPIIPAALRHVGHPANRNRGTFGGSVAHADPAAELPAVLLALGAELVASGPGGERVIGADDFFVTYYTTVLAADEVLTEVRLPQRYDASRTAWSFLELARRQGDFAVGGTALVAEVDGDGLVTSARVCLLGVADRPVRARQAEDFLVGKRLGDQAVAREAGQLAAGDLTPVSDVHGSAQYRKEVAAVLVARAAVDSATRLEGGR